MNRVAIRVDASGQIGFGHVKRCLALAQALRSAGAEVRFFVRPGDVDAAGLVAAAGFCAVGMVTTGHVEAGAGDLPHAAWLPCSPAQDAAATLAAFGAWQPSLVIVDHYALDRRWHGALRQATGACLVAIDDLADRDLAVDAVIDHNHALDHAAKYAGRLCGPLGARTPVFGGPQFALLGPAYAAAPRCAAAVAVRSIGIFMGGTDPGGASAMALAAVQWLGFEGGVEVASTSANPGLRALMQAAASRPGTRLLLDQPDLAQFFARHDLQIGAGGGATWERCCIGAPTLALVLAENQRAVLEPLAGLGVVQTTEPTLPAVATALRRLIEDAAGRAAMSARARSLVDGHGAARAAAALLELP